jgi:acylphosphatase
MQNYKFTVSGRVQAVYYRKTTCQNAQKENYNGYVKNLPNGDVEACVSCKKEDLDTFINILKSGSTNSKITNIEQLEIDEVFINKFEVRY